MPETVQVKLEDATFAQLKTHATTAMGLQIHPATNKPEAVIAKMKAADPDLKAIPVDAPPAVDPAVKPATAPKVDQSASKGEGTPAPAEETEEEKAAKKAEFDKAVDEAAEKKANEKLAAKQKADDEAAASQEPEPDPEPEPEADEPKKLSKAEIKKIEDDHEKEMNVLWWIQIQVQEGKFGAAPISLSVNGRALLVPRGVKCPIKRKYLEVLRNAIADKHVWDPKTGKTNIAKAPMYPTSEFGEVTPESEKMATDEEKEMLVAARKQA